MKNKHICQILSIGLIIVLAGFISGCSSTQKFVKLTATDISDMVAAKQFVFIANKINPLRGPQRHLTAYYDVSVDKDSLSTFLPYFGRVFQGYVDPVYGPLHFSSNNFYFSVSKGKKDSYKIMIKPQNNIQVQTMYFEIFDNGSATLNINSSNMDPITFYGYVQPLDPGSFASKQE